MIRFLFILFLIFPCSITVFGQGISTGFVNIQTDPEDVSVYIDGAYSGKTPFRIEMPAGKHTLKLEIDGYKTIEEQINVKNNEPCIIYKELKKFRIKGPRIKKYRDYIVNSSEYAINTSVGFFTGASLNLTPFSFYYKNFNLDLLCVGFGLGTAYKKWDMEYPVYLGVNFGYGLRMAERVRLTPQVGFRWFGTSESVLNNYQKYSATSLSLGIRFDYAFSHNFTIFAVPAYNYNIGNDKSFNKIISLDNNIKRMSEGFSLRLGVSVILLNDDD